MAKFPLFYSAFSEVISNNPKKSNNLLRLKNSPKRFLGHNPEPRSEVWWWNLRWSFGGKCFWRVSPANEARKSPSKLRRKFATNLAENFANFTLEIAGAWKRNPNLNFLVRIFSGRVGVFHVKGWGAEKFGMSLEARETKLFWQAIPGFCRDIRGARKKKSLCSIFVPYFLQWDETPGAQPTA